jgi:Transcription factor WhiB
VNADDWMRYAACANSPDPEIFFDSKRYRQAVQVCRTCPVMEQCRQARRGAAGVWGGRVFGGVRPRSSLRGFLLDPCGTEGAYRRHIRNGQKPCPDCIHGHTMAREARRGRRKIMPK